MKSLQPTLLTQSLRARWAARPLLGAVITGAALTLCSLAVSLLTLFALHLMLPVESWGPSAASSLGKLSDVGLFFVAVLLIPPVETLLAQLIPMEVLRRLGGGAGVCVVASALLFGIGHFLNGGLAHGLATFTTGLVFASGYVCWRPAGVLPAFVAANTTHATHNFVLLFVLAKIAPEWA